MTQQHSISSIELNQAICAIALAHQKATAFPGLSIVPSLTQEWTFAIRHGVDHDFDCDAVALDELVVTTECMVTELEGRYGPGGERLGDVVLDFSINTQPA